MSEQEGTSEQDTNEQVDIDGVKTGSLLQAAHWVLDSLLLNELPPDEVRAFLCRAVAHQEEHEEYLVVLLAKLRADLGEAHAGVVDDLIELLEQLCDLELVRTLRENKLKEIEPNLFALVPRDA